MAKLSHIEDIELKRAQEALQQARGQEQQKARQSQATRKMQETQDMEPNRAEVHDDAEEVVSSTASGSQNAQGAMTAQQEADFHGIDTNKPMSVGHRFLIILAVLVTVAAILYIVNSWVHFI